MNRNDVLHLKLSKFLGDAFSDFDGVTIAFSKEYKVVDGVCGEEEVMLAIGVFIYTYGETFLLAIHCLIWGYKFIIGLGITRNVYKLAHFFQQ